MQISTLLSNADMWALSDRRDHRTRTAELQKNIRNPTDVISVVFILFIFWLIREMCLAGGWYIQ